MCFCFFIQGRACYIKQISKQRKKEKKLYYYCPVQELGNQLVCSVVHHYTPEGSWHLFPLQILVYVLFQRLQLSSPLGTITVILSSVLRNKRRPLSHLYSKAFLLLNSPVFKIPIRVLEVLKYILAVINIVTYITYFPLGV